MVHARLLFALGSRLWCGLRIMLSLLCESLGLESCWVCYRSVLFQSHTVCYRLGLYSQFMLV